MVSARNGKLSLTYLHPGIQQLLMFVSVKKILSEISISNYLKENILNFLGIVLCL